MTPQEAGRKGVEARRRKAEQAEQAAQDAEARRGSHSRTFRQRLGASLSKLDQPTLDAVVEKLAKAGNAAALARLADQAFGRPSEQDEGSQQQAGLLGQLSRDELASALASLDEGAPADAAPLHAHARTTGAEGHAPTPAGHEPHGGDLLREPLAEAETPAKAPRLPKLKDLIEDRPRTFPGEQPPHIEGQLSLGD